MQLGAGLERLQLGMAQRHVLTRHPAERVGLGNAPGEHARQVGGLVDGLLENRDVVLQLEGVRGDVDLRELLGHLERRVLERRVRQQQLVPLLCVLGQHARDRGGVLGPLVVTVRSISPFFSTALMAS